MGASRGGHCAFNPLSSSVVCGRCRVLHSGRVEPARRHVPSPRYAANDQWCRRRPKRLNEERIRPPHTHPASRGRGAFVALRCKLYDERSVETSPDTHRARRARCPYARSRPAGGVCHGVRQWQSYVGIHLSSEVHNTGWRQVPSRSRKLSDHLWQAWTG